MFINAIACTNNLQNKSTPTSFKQGLTRDIVTHVKNMPSDEYQRITHRLWRKYGMIASTGCSNTVAFCVEKTADIMSKAGYILPKIFEFTSLCDTSYGEFDITHKVKINSDRKEFLDLEKLNERAEKENSYNESKHFLDTYLHEFLHSAHCNNIIKNKGYMQGCDIFWDDLSDCRPLYSLWNPLVTFIKKLFPSIKYEQTAKLFSENRKLLQTDDLTEYFAQINAKKLANQLGDNFDIKNVQKNMAHSYSGFPENWNINDEVRKIVSAPVQEEGINESLKYILNYFEGEIWNGNIDNIINNSRAIRNYAGKLKHANK